MRTTIAFIRTTLFIFLFYAPFTIFWASLSVLIAWAIPFRYRFYFVIYCWSAVVIFLARWVLGIRYEVKGRENIPAKGIIACNHQSPWETYFLQTLFHPQTQVLKKSLLNIPFFGWAFRLLSPIALDRDDRRASMQQLLEQGAQHMQRMDTYVMVFPEGTRKAPGELGKFTRGAAALAKHVGVPLIPVAQNAGYCWIGKSYIKYPGLITVTVLPPVSLDELSTKEATDMARASIQEALETTAQ